MNYLEQTHQDIRLYVLEGESDLEQFSILESETYSWQGKSITFGILGASHFITVTSSLESVTEICACVPGVFADTTLVHIDSPIEKLTPNVQKSIGNTMYTFSANVIAAEEGAERMNDLLLYKIGDHVLSHEFPSNKPTVTPITLIKVSNIGNELITQTVHTYPNEDIMVFTVSTLKYTDE